MTDDEVIFALKARVEAGRPSDHGASQPPPPATARALALAEAVIGLPLPPLLRRIYAEVANGGVGPFAGIDGVDGGYASDVPMLEMYSDYRAAYLAAELDPDSPPPPPAGVVFLCDFGCAMWVLVDCRHPEGQMWWWEEGDRYKVEVTFGEWIRAWLEGRLSAAPAMRGFAVPDEAWARD